MIPPTGRTRHKLSSTTFAPSRLTASRISTSSTSRDVQGNSWSGPRALRTASKNTERSRTRISGSSRPAGATARSYHGEDPRWHGVADLPAGAGLLDGAPDPNERVRAGSQRRLPAALHACIRRDSATGPLHVFGRPLGVLQRGTEPHR